MGQGNRLASGGGGVKIITSRTCPKCEELKAELRAKGIEFEELDIDSPEGLMWYSYYDASELPFVVPEEK